MNTNVDRLSHSHRHWVTVVLLAGLMAVGACAQTLTTLAAFTSKNGDSPQGALVQGLDGNFYGTTTKDGAKGYGTVFKVSTAGLLTTLYSFSGPDGESPVGLMLASNGTLYGATLSGGSGTACGYGCGTIFKITPAGKLTTLYSFSITDGSAPSVPVQGIDGNLYGATFSGGANLWGTAFKMTPSGALTTLHNFDVTDGGYPEGLVQGSDGNLYGTTQSGGANNYGTVFKMTRAGAVTTLYSFPGTGFASPNGGLIQGSDGNFYGTTYGTANYYYGSVFRITPGGTLTTLWSFDLFDGANPLAGLVQGTDGYLYGTTSTGGAVYNGGTVFRIDTGGSGGPASLYNFSGADGYDPVASLIQGTDGNFYGTTFEGGQYVGYCTYWGCGTVFKLVTGLGAFVKALPGLGAVGTPVKILGTNLTGTTSVSFNGTTAVFTVVSSSEITTTVPTGATTGSIQVTTPGGVLSSNRPFVVRP